MGGAVGEGTRRHVMTRAWMLLIWFAFVGATGVAAPDAIVAADGTGDFRSLQEAISAAPMRTDPAVRRWDILVKPGTYRERIYVQRERGRIRVRGEDAARTVIAFDLHAKQPGADGRPLGTFRTATVQIDGDGMVWENLTIANTAGPVGQAVALRVDGDRCEFRGCRFLGWQDTLLLNRGRHYFADCYIEGHVDFIFGGATAYFDRCEVHVLKDGYLTAASTPKGQAYGFIIADGKITGEPGVKTYLGRPWRDFARTVFLRTEMSSVVRGEGWHNWNKPQAEVTAFYGEFSNTGPGAEAGARVPWAKRLTDADAAALTPARVLGGNDGWNPAAKAPAARKVRVVLVGDSTVTDDKGWGRGFKQLLTDETECINMARGGRSSKSYRAEGHWASALALGGDYYLLQFGHNDVPGKGPARETDAATTYRENMARYVDEVRAIGAQPVLVTSLARRDFDPSGNGKLVSTLTAYAAAVRAVAAEKHVPLVDLDARSTEWCEQAGPVETAKLNPLKEGKPDTTHLDAAGSAVFAQLVADELRRAVPAFAAWLRAMPAADVLRDIEYARAAGEPLLLDVHVAEGEGPFPVAIVVHGGGWSRGDKRAMPAGDGADISPILTTLSAANFTWFSINYRLASEHRWPAGLEDVQTAIRWVKAHAHEFKGDPQRIALLGHSAGGHLVCLAATLADESTRVQAVVGYAAVTDLVADTATRGGVSPSLQALFGCAVEPTRETLAVLREDSPIEHVRSGLPPFLLVHGEADRTVPLQQSLDFQAKLRAAGTRGDLITIPDAPHALASWEQRAPEYPGRVTAWLRDALNPAQP